MENAIILNQPQQILMQAPSEGANYTSGTNSALTLTYAGTSGESVLISGIAWSYSAAPTGGNLSIVDSNSNTLFELDVTAAGPGFIPFNPPIATYSGVGITVNLAAAGSGIVGRVNALGVWKAAIGAPLP